MLGKSAMPTAVFTGVLVSSYIAYLLFLQTDDFVNVYAE
jgi:hypothetical protein